MRHLLVISKTKLKLSNVGHGKLDNYLSDLVSCMQEVRYERPSCITTTFYAFLAHFVQLKFTDGLQAILTDDRQI